MIIILQYNPDELNYIQENFNTIINDMFSNTIDTTAEILESNPINENKLENNFILFNIE